MSITQISLGVNQVTRGDRSACKKSLGSRIDSILKHFDRETKLGAGLNLINLAEGTGSAGLSISRQWPGGEIEFRLNVDLNQSHPGSINCSFTLSTDVISVAYAGTVKKRGTQWILTYPPYTPSRIIARLRQQSRRQKNMVTWPEVENAIAKAVAVKKLTGRVSISGGVAPFAEESGTIRYTVGRQAIAWIGLEGTEGVECVVMTSSDPARKFLINFSQLVSDKLSELTEARREQLVEDARKRYRVRVKV